MLTLPNEKDGIAVENWTKWQVYVRQSPEDDTPVVVYAQTSDTVAFQNKVSTYMEKRNSNSQNICMMYVDKY